MEGVALLLQKDRIVIVKHQDHPGVVIISALKGYGLVGAVVRTPQRVGTEFGFTVSGPRAGAP